jgi:serine/threonine-protein kinase HipA
MSICGERAGAGKAHLLKLAGSEALTRGTALAIIDEVAATLGRWPEFADEAKVPRTVSGEVAVVLQLQLKS